MFCSRDTEAAESYAPLCIVQGVGCEVRVEVGCEVCIFPLVCQMEGCWHETADDSPHSDFLRLGALVKESVGDLAL